MSRRLTATCALLLGAALGCGGAGGRPSRNSVLLITLDTTRADRLGAYGAPDGSTPAFDALARRGRRFDRAFAVAPMTLPAHASIFTGRLPPATGVRWNGEHRLDASTPTLATAFAAAGYSTGAFVSAAVLDSAFGLDRGFAVYDDDVGAGGPYEAERAGVESVRRALAWLERQERGQPVFLWVHLFEPHDPYAPPAPFAERFQADPYAGEVAAADAAAQPLLEHPRFRDGIVSVIGDHGESLGEHGEATHGLLVHEAALRVPWLLAAPGVDPGSNAEPVSQVDLAPTLLALAGLDPLPSIDGEALAGSADATPPRGRTLYAESLYGEHVYGWAPLHSARKGGLKLVRGARDELFDIVNDPGELANRAAVSAAETTALGQELERLLRPGATAASAAAVNEELRNQISNLGYLGGPSKAATDAPAAPAGASANDPRDRVAVHEKFRAIDAALKRGEIEAARRGVREILAVDPENRLAIRAAATETQSDPRLDELLREAGTAIAERRFADAERAAQSAIELDSRSPAALNALGIALEESGRAPAAEREYEAALVADPGYLRAELNLALLRAARGGPSDRDRAVAGLERVLAAAPREPLALWTLARLAAERGERERSAALLTRFLAAAPGHPRADEARRILATLNAS